MFSHSQQHGHIPEDLACRSNYIKHACNFPLRLQDHIPLGRAMAGRMGPTHEQPAQSRALSGLSPWLLVWEVLRMEEVSTSSSSWEVEDTLLGSTCCPVTLRGCGEGCGRGCRRLLPHPSQQPVGMAGVW